MVSKTIKMVLIGGVSVVVIGGLLFGSDLASYMKSSAKSVQTAVKDSVPLEFELQRAQDLLEEVIPEMHANIRLIAQEEVEIAQLKEDITQSGKRLVQQRQKVNTLRQNMDVPSGTATTPGQPPRTQLAEELSQRFEQLKEAEMVLAGKQRLLVSRQQALQAAMQMLDRSRSQKQLLQDRISGLESQYRLVQAATTASGLHMDNSKLAQTQKLLTQIKKRLDVAERVMAHESRFTETVQAESTVDEKELLTQVDDYFAAPAKDAAQPAPPEYSVTPESNKR